MTNFDFLTSDPQFNTFSSVAVSAEKILHIDPSASILNCRRCMEFAVKWMYSVDAELKLPVYDDSLNTLMGTEEFRSIMGAEILNRMHFIRKLGNNVAHSNRKITEEQARKIAESFLKKQECYARQYGVKL